MAPAHVLEPTYFALRRRLLAGFWPPGFRLESGKLATDLDVSATPVRDSLNRLAGERLIDAVAGAGFQVPRLEEAAFVRLIDWHRALIRLAIEKRSGSAAFSILPPESEGHAQRAVILFSVIASRAGNSELDWAIGNAAARLGQFRRCEADVIPHVAQELHALETAARSTQAKRLLTLVDQYHDRRRDNAFALVQAAEAAHE